MTLYLELKENPKGTSQMTGQRMTANGIHHYVRKNVRTQADIYRYAILEALRDADREVPHYEEAVFLNVTFFYEIKAKKRWGQWKTSKPDCDNAVKLLQDVMTKMGFWKDDSQIARLMVKKVLAERPGILIEAGRLIQP